MSEFCQQSCYLNSVFTFQKCIDGLGGSIFLVVRGYNHSNMLRC